VSGQLHASAALPPGKELPVLVEQEAGWDPAVSKRRSPCHCWESNPGHSARMEM